MMRQPETLQSLIDRLDRFNLTNLEFKDIAIKSAELIRQVFPTNFVEAVYQIKAIDNGTSDLYSKKVQLKSILEAKLDSILRVQQARETVERDNQLKRQQVEEQAAKTKAIIDDEKIMILQSELKKATDSLQEIKNRETGYINQIDLLSSKLNVKNRIKIVREVGFWGTMAAACALFLAAGYYWGNSKFDSEKFQLKEQRDHYRAQVDSMTKLSTGTIKLQRQTIERMRFVSDSALNILGHMPYDQMKLDPTQFHKVQSNIEAAGAALYLNINHK